ncbi:trypsin 5G1-like [Toxorhynchites rutilus septentrionalis]|uniref:trypsin 5G1-like n=1 Tax=Toxorhynchites rutilus septentrionalis TaxID=329112 RepID=UPI00247865AC|nr:trypsin 5G1-like [Toxorhynchites rutilus septentrionalis]
MYRQFGLLIATCIAVSYGISSISQPLRPWWNDAPSTGRVVGGYEVDILDVPFQVSVANDYGHFCGGTIIGERWILTAGHCVDEDSYVALMVRVGSSRRSNDGQLLKVKRVVRHPLYDSWTIDYDYALLELEEAIELNEKFYAAELPEENEPVADGTLLQVSGWGQTLNSLESNEVLRAAYVPSVSQESCARAYASSGLITERMLCAGYEKGGKDSCQGDSGGPLVEGTKLVGVVSWGMGCALEGFPGVYARVAVARNWIRQHSGL